MSQDTNNPAEVPTVADREVLNVRQAASYLGISVDSFYKYLADKRYGIPGFKLGNRWRFKRSGLNRWMEERSRGTK